DGRFLAFFADGKLKKIPAAGGNPEELCDAPFALAGTWNPTGTILFSKLDPPGIYSAPDGGGEAVRITTPAGERTETNHIWPHFLPDGRRFLYLANRAPGASGVTRELRVASLDSKENRALTTRIASRVEYVPPGFLVYAREGALFAQRFDDRSARLSGEPQQLAANVHYFYGPSLAAFSTSETGDLVYQRAAGLSRLVWFDRQGKEIGQLGAPSLVKGLRISPDGGSAAAAIGDPRWGTSDIWVFDAGRGISTRLHSDPVDEMMPVWAADGSKVLYRSDRQGPPDIYEIAVGVPGSEKPVLALPGLQQPEDVSRDGRLLAYVQEVASTVWNIWLLPLEGERKPASWRRTRFNESSPRFSPDGRWIAYESNESGDPEIYVALTNGGGEKRRISPGGGRRPRWRRDGKELYYSDRGGVMAVPVTPGSRWESGTPALLFRVEPDIENYDVAPDGSRFLVILPLEKVRESPLRVILNWTAAMKRP
ncbi:MAG TPA: hypothetical protein VN971_09290, partial [Thermoanaerobaculia bacterium]|nr:hypothetical protein [Thermoanaerobaculia bacterium]